MSLQWIKNVVDTNQKLKNADRINSKDINVTMKKLKGIKNGISMKQL